MKYTTQVLSIVIKKILAKVGSGEVEKSGYYSYV